MILSTRLLLSITISSIIYPVTILYAGKSLPEIQIRRHQKAYGFQKMPRQTKDQRIAEKRYETRQNSTRLQDQYDSGLAIAKARQIDDLTKPVKPKSQQSPYRTRSASKNENPNVAQKVTSNGKVLRISLRNKKESVYKVDETTLPNGLKVKVLALNAPQIKPAYNVQSSNGQVVKFLGSSSTVQDKNVIDLTK